MIYELGQDYSLLRLIDGDFKEILLAEEQFGGVGVDFNSLNAFRSFLELYDLEDLGADWYTFTLSNKRYDGFIEERLDKCVANSSWRQIFDDASVENVIWDGSDHFQIVLRIRKDEFRAFSSLNKDKPF